MRLSFAALLTVALAACQSVPATKLVAVPTGTLFPGETAVASATATQVPAAALVFTPTVSPAELKRRAGPICENSFSAPVETGSLVPPFAVLKKSTYADAPSWDLAHQLPHLGSLSAADVKTVFCISESRTQTRTYADGSAAYQLSWEVRAVTWPGGKVIGRNSFHGALPPFTRQSAAVSVEGSLPDRQFAGWVFAQVDHPDFLYFNDAVTKIAISPRGDLAAFGTSIANEFVDRDYEAKILLFKPSDMQILSGLAGHRGMVTALAFSPDGKVLASAGFDLFVKFWDLATGHLLGQVNIPDTPNSLAFSPDGRKLAVASNLDVAFIDLATMHIEQSLQEASGRDLAYSPNGKRVYVNSLGSIKVIDPAANVVMLTFPDPFALVPTLSVSADGSGTSVAYASPGTVEGFALSPDGTEIISYTVDRSVAREPGAENVRLAAWDAETGKFRREIRFSGDLIETVKFSPNGSLLAIGNLSSIWIWNTSSSQMVKELSGHNGFIADLAFGPDGNSLLSAGGDGTIRIWSLEE